MKWRELETEPCPIARTLSVVGDRWTVLILREAFLKAKRFEEFSDALGLTRHVLASRLKKLVEHGVLQREAYQERPVRHEYRLTDKGLALYPVLVALNGWGSEYMAEPGEALLRYRHRRCGADASPQMTCVGCGEPIAARDMEIRIEGVPADTPWTRAVAKRYASGS